MPFSSVFIIYNPNSTGPSRVMAEQLAQQIGEVAKVELRATKRAGHAEELAYEIARSDDEPLIVSSSGDGGYHEVINGVMRGSEEGHSAIAAVLPAGNANDHSRTVERHPLAEAITAGNVTTLDLLHATITQGGKTTERYAHSYIGLGLTPTIAVELNRHSLSAWREMLIVIKGFYGLRPVAIKEEGSVKKYDSLIISNIKQMAKVLTMSQQGDPQDGKFEITTFPQSPKLLLLWRLLKSVFGGLKANRRVTNFSFSLVKAAPMQLDGEVMELAAGATVEVKIKPRALRTVI